MPRVAPLPPEALERFAPMFELLEATYGFVPNSMLTMGRRPELLEAFSALARTVLAAEGEVAPGLRWLVAHVASRASGCRYCQAHTAHNASAVAGVDGAKLEAIWEFETSARFDDAERAALRLAAAAAVVPNEATDAHFEELRRHFGDGAIVEIVAVVALFGFLNRWNDTMATGLELPAVAFADRHLADQGWEAGKHA